MILKGAQRGGGKQLALHLLNTRDNEHVELHEIRGFASSDVVGAMKEAHAASRGTKCKQFLFSVSLSPPPQERVANEVFEDAIRRIEERNNLSGQPRVILFHEKEGRRHAHAVWSRIDAETMTAKGLPFFKLKLRDISRELYLENDWKMPRGLMNSREADPRNFTLAEWHQAKRAGRDARDLKAMMQECWAASDSHAAFAQALKARGFTLAAGDRRGHVALSPEGEVFSVARMVGKKAKDVQARLGDPALLPDVGQAKAQLAKDLSATFKRHMREAEESKRRDLAPLEARRQGMVQTQQRERAQLQAKQQERWQAEIAERQARFRSGARGLWDRISGKHAEIRKANEREAYAALARDREQRQRLIFSQMNERQILQAEIKAVRERHAATLRELRADRLVSRRLENEARTTGKEANASRSRSIPPPQQKQILTSAERIDRLRKGADRPAPPRNRGWDRER